MKWPIRDFMALAPDLVRPVERPAGDPTVDLYPMRQPRHRPIGLATAQLSYPSASPLPARPRCLSAVPRVVQGAGAVDCPAAPVQPSRDTSRTNRPERSDQP